MRIKICGITNLADAVRAANLGADAIGLNFYALSKRYIDEAVAAAILSELPPSVEPVALFVNLELVKVVESAQRLPGVRFIQWHGERHEAFRFPPYRFIPAFQVAGREDLLRVMAYLDHCQAVDALPTAVLVDGQGAGQYGGTGHPAPWKLLADFRPPLPLILAGGLTPENVAEAIRIVHPYAVDVASGVESSPGRKDEDKMRRFIKNAREAAAKFGLPDDMDTF